MHIGKDEQFTPQFVAINPNSKIPAIIDQDGPDRQPLTVFESGAILLYLAEKTGKYLAPKGRARSDALQWLMFQMGGVGPIFGQVHHFLRAAKEPIPYAIERYSKEKDRLYSVLDKHLKDHQYLAGEYSIADMATYPWVARHEWHKVALADLAPELRAACRERAAGAGHAEYHLCHRVVLLSGSRWGPGSAPAAAGQPPPRCAPRQSCHAPRRWRRTAAAGR